MSQTTEQPKPNEDYEQFELAEGSPLRDLADRRARLGNDLAIAVVDWHGRGGFGKTTLSCKLGHALDRSGQGLKRHMAYMNPEPFRAAYSKNAKKTPLILDELEKEANKYQAATKAARAVTEIIDMGRVKEKYVIANLPTKRSITDDLLSRFDVLIAVQNRGRALVHVMPHEFYSDTILKKKAQVLSWGPIPNNHQVAEVKAYLDDRKEDYLNSKGGDHWVHADDVDERVATARDDARIKARGQIVRHFHANTDLGQTDIAKALSGEDLHDDLDISQTTVHRILKDDQ